MRCRICRHPGRVAIEAAASDGGIRAAAERFSLSELALERHLLGHGLAERAPDTVRDDEPPATSRSPSLPTSATIVAGVPDIGRVRSALAEAMAHLDAIESRSVA